MSTITTDNKKAISERCDVNGRCDELVYFSSLFVEQTGTRIYRFCFSPQICVVAKKPSIADASKKVATKLFPLNFAPNADRFIVGLVGKSVTGCPHMPKCAAALPCQNNVRQLFDLHCPFSWFSAPPCSAAVSTSFYGGSSGLQFVVRSECEERATTSARYPIG